MSEYKGYISRQYTVWCGVCGQWDQRDNARDKAHMAKLARRSGWSFSKEHGWRCPNCVQAKRTELEKPERVEVRGGK